MNRRLVLGGMTLAVLLGIVLVPRTDRSARTRADSSAQPAAEARRLKDLENTLGAHPQIQRPMASYRVHEEKKADGLVHRGGGYVAQTTGRGLHFEAGGSFLELAAVRLEQGGQAVALKEGTVSSPAFGDVRIDRGSVVEQYIFENTRAEQIFRIAQPLGAGALRVVVAARTDLGGKVIPHRRTDGGWVDTTFQEGGLAFTDERGRNRFAYHSAIAFDAQGRRADLEPTYSNGEITLEVPEAFMATASYPVVIDPWLELDFSASSGGLSKSAGVSQTPAVVVVGGGNPWVAWSERVGSNFEVFFRYWNGFKWSNLGGSDTGTGISGNSGDSIHPVITTGDIGPYIAWQDDTDGTSQVYLKHWNGSVWEELASTTPFNGNPITNSASSGGVSLGIGSFSAYPSLSQMTVTIPTSGALKIVPVLSYQSTNPGPTSIITIGYFPGDPGQLATFDPSGAPLLLNFPVIPTGWYAFGGNGAAGQYSTTQMSGTLAGFVSQRSSLVVPAGSVTPIVAWQDTRAGTHDIMAARFVPAGAPLPNAPIFPASRPPSFAFGAWAGMAGSFAAGGITVNTPGAQPFSITPSLAMNGATPTIAWEQVFNVTSSEIYLAEFGGVAWTGLGGSFAGAGLSGTALTISATPSLAITGGVPYVAWQEDQPGNSEIYVRRYNGGAGWDEVGFMSNSGTVVPIGGVGGVSQTTGASLSPSIGGNGDITVAWQDFAGGNFEVFLRRFYENQPLFLLQTTALGVTVIPFGSGTTDSTIELRATAFSEDVTRLVRLQVEIVPVGSTFVGRITQESGEVAVDPGTHQSTTPLIIPFSGLVNVSYQWRARTVDDLGRASAWISAGASDGATDFSVTAASTTAPGTPSALTVSLVGGIVTLNWTAPSGGADSYNVKRSIVAGGGGYPPATIISTSGAVTTTTFQDTATTAGNTYFYVVSAVRSALESTTNSNEVSITLPAGTGGAGTASLGEDKSRCGLTGLEGLLGLALLALWRRRRR